MVSWGICCAVQSQVWLLMSSPMHFPGTCCSVFFLLQALGPGPSSRDASSAAVPLRDVLATEPV